MYFYSGLTELLNRTLQINFKQRTYVIIQKYEVDITRFHTIKNDTAFTETFSKCAPKVSWH